MIVRQLGVEADGTRSVEIRANQLSYRALLRTIRKIPGAKVLDASHDPLNDNADILVKYRGVTIEIDTPFSDYIVNCLCQGDAFDSFVDALRKYEVKWWERFM